MKKYFRAFMVTMMTVCFSACLVSCGEDDVTSSGQKDPEPVVKESTGTYDLHCPVFVITYWPDSEAGITTQFQSFYDDIAKAVGVDGKKEYKWSDIEASKDKLQKAFDAFGDFEYSVKSCRNYSRLNGDITFKAYKDGNSSADIDFGAKHVKCTLDIPADVTSQLHIEMKTFELGVPSAKEYLDKVRGLYADALKDVFTGEYGVMKGIAQVEYLNMYNHTGDRKEISERISKACEGVVVPELPADIKKEAADAKVKAIFTISVFAYDPHSTSIMKSDEDVFSSKIAIE